VTEEESADDDADDPGPVWQHLPDVGVTRPADGQVVESQGVTQRAMDALEADGAVAADDPTAFAAVPAAWRLVRARRPELVVSVALIAVMLGPVLTIVDDRKAAFTSMLVPLALVPMSLVTPARSTTRTALAHLAGAIAVSAGMSVVVHPVLGVLLAIAYIPLVALLPAYWMTASWMAAVRLVGRFAVRRWLSTLALTWCTFVALALASAGPAIAVDQLELSSTWFEAIWVAVATAMVILASGYAQVAIGSSDVASSAGEEEHGAGEGAGSPADGGADRA